MCWKPIKDTRSRLASKRTSKSILVWVQTIFVLVADLVSDRIPDVVPDQVPYLEQDLVPYLVPDLVPDLSTRYGVRSDTRSGP